MTTRYGFSEEAWAAAKEEMRQAMIQRAKVRGMIPYSELVETVTEIELEPNSYALAAMLGEISSPRCGIQGGGSTVRSALSTTCH